MITKENIKIFAFGGMTAAFLWLAYGMKGKGDLLDQALTEINAARREIDSAQNDIKLAKVNIDSAQKILQIMRLAAEQTRYDLNNLQKERNKIYTDIDQTIASSKQSLVKYEYDINKILSRQKALIAELDAIGIKNLYIQPSKKE
jgi:uncharacterized protein (DUF3084 family)